VKDNASRALFFVWQPTVGKPVDEVTIWLNGGPGKLWNQSTGSVTKIHRLQLPRRILPRKRPHHLDLGTICTHY
jgi:hypothetical protein